MKKNIIGLVSILLIGLTSAILANNSVKSSVESVIQTESRTGYNACYATCIKYNSEQSCYYRCKWHLGE